MKQMNKLLTSVKSKSFWNEFLQAAKTIVILSYLGELKEADNVLGFWVVVFVFGFQPVYKLIQAKPWRKK